MFFSSISLLALVASVCAKATELDIKTVNKPSECSIQTQNGDKLSMHYTGHLKTEDGSVFDSSRTRGSPFEFTIGVGQVIQGWEKGLLNMCIGETRILTIPASMGYGANGYPPVIPGDSTLVFDVELLAIKNRKADSSVGQPNIQKEVEDAIAQNHIVIFSKSYCPWSKKAKAAIAAVPSKKSEPKIFELDLLGEEGQEMQDYLLKKSGQRTVPNVWIGQKHIGGSDAVTALVESDQLAKLCQGSSDSYGLMHYGAGLALFAIVGLGVRSFRGNKGRAGKEP